MTISRWPLPYIGKRTEGLSARLAEPNGSTNVKRTRIPTLFFRTGFLVGAGSFVLTAIFRHLLFALMKSLHYRRSPWYQHSLICKALRKGSVILLHDVENSFLGELSMVLGE